LENCLHRAFLEYLSDILQPFWHEPLMKRERQRLSMIPQHRLKQARDKLQNLRNFLFRYKQFAASENNAPFEA